MVKLRTVPSGGANVDAANFLTTGGREGQAEVWTPEGSPRVAAGDNPRAAVPKMIPSPGWGGRVLVADDTQHELVDAAAACGALRNSKGHNATGSRPAHADGKQTAAPRGAVTRVAPRPLSVLDTVIGAANSFAFSQQLCQTNCPPPSDSPLKGSWSQTDMVPDAELTCLRTSRRLKYGDVPWLSRSARLATVVTLVESHCWNLAPGTECAAAPQAS